MYGNNGFQKIFVVNEITKALYDSPAILIDHSIDAIRSASLFGLLGVEKGKVCNILAKISICVKELIMNVYTYEDEVKFFVGINVDEKGLSIAFRFKGDEFNIESVNNMIALKEKMMNEGKDVLNGAGLVFVKQNADSMEISETNEPFFKKQIEIKFNLKGE